MDEEAQFDAGSSEEIKPVVTTGADMASNDEEDDKSVTGGAAGDMTSSPSPTDEE